MRKEISVALLEAEREVAAKLENATVAQYAYDKAREDHNQEVKNLRLLEQELHIRQARVKKLEEVVKQMSHLVEANYKAKVEAELKVSELKREEEARSKKRLHLIESPSEFHHGDPETQEEIVFTKIENFPVKSLIYQESNLSDDLKRIRIIDVTSIKKLLGILKTRVSTVEDAGKTFKSAIIDIKNIEKTLKGNPTDSHSSDNRDRFEVDTTVYHEPAKRANKCVFCSESIPSKTPRSSCDGCVSHSYHPVCLAFLQCMIKDGASQVCLGKAGVVRSCKNKSF